MPLAALLDDTYAAERACQISETTALVKPLTTPGNPASYDGSCATAAPGQARVDTDTENISTTNLTVADRWGNVVEYTLTIEQTGGSGIVVPGRGFILNNELTDFSAVYKASDPNRIQPGKRPRSSMSPTIVLKDGEPWLALGSPGGSTIITTVLQMLFNRIDRGMTIEQAIAAPRAAQRNTASVTAEQSFIDAYGALLTPYGHKFAAAGTPGSSRRRDRCRDRHRDRPRWPDDRRRRARAPWRRLRWRGGAEVAVLALPWCCVSPSRRKSPSVSRRVGAIGPR